MLPTALPAPPALPDGAQNWINQNLLGITLPEIALPVPLADDKGALPPMTVQLVDDWIVLRTEGPKGDEIESRKLASKGKQTSIANVEK